MITRHVNCLFDRSHYEKLAQWQVMLQEMDTLQQHNTDASRAAKHVPSVSGAQIPIRSKCGAWEHTVWTRDMCSTGFWSWKCTQIILCQFWCPNRAHVQCHVAFLRSHSTTVCHSISHCQWHSNMWPIPGIENSMSRLHSRSSLWSHNWEQTSLQLYLSLSAYKRSHAWYTDITWNRCSARGIHSRK